MNARTAARLALLVRLVASLPLGSCHEPRHRGSDPAPTYLELAPLLEERCVSCHGEERAEGGYALDRYDRAIGCTPDGKVATSPGSSEAPIIAVLARSDHEQLLDERERHQLLAWVEAGARDARHIMHDQGILDPRSDAWHGKLASQDGFAPLVRDDHPATCARCHAGTPMPAEDSSGSTEGATACTACHNEPGGVFACTTCHGQRGRPYPPRDQCYFAGQSRDAHDAHANPRLRSRGLDCATCHPAPGESVLGGSHGNGSVELLFAPLAGDEASFSDEDQRCAVACHARGGRAAQPSWTDTEPLDCQSCHLSPPQDHYAGPCSTCHGNMGKGPESLELDDRHINGKVDVGADHGERCGACHGIDDSGLPGDRTHRAHRDTQLTLPVACESCHIVPRALRDGTHLNGQVDVRFSGRALTANADAAYEAATRTCSEVACHGGALEHARGADVSWDERWSTQAPCTGCHATPPEPPHVQMSACGGGLCHGAEVASDDDSHRITESGRLLHIDGRVR